MKDQGSIPKFPGDWLLLFPSKDGKSTLTTEPMSNLVNIQEKAYKIIRHYQSQELEFNPYKFIIVWRCSDNDPRIGKEGFRSSYHHGRYNIFGDYIHYLEADI